MKPNKVLKVKAVEGSNVINFDAMRAKRLQFVGKKFNPETDEFDILANGETVTYRSEYLSCLKSGELLPMDSETAKLAGIKFAEPVSKPSK